MEPISVIEAVTVTPNPAVDWTLSVPAFIAGAVNRAEVVSREAAGKGVNVAAVLAAYGHRVAVTGFLGRDNEALFTGLFRRRAIADHFVRLDGETRVGVKLTDPERGETTDVNLPGLAPGAEALERLHAGLMQLAAPGLRVVLAGSLPPDMAPTFYRDLVGKLKAAGCRVFVDTSGAPLAHAVEAVPHVLKPNVHELDTLVGRSLTTPRDVVAAARELTDRGVELVAVSMGERGALFVTESRAVLARPPAITVRSTVGAGDAMVAGIVAADLAEYPLPDAARLATAFSLHALTQGRDAAMPADAVLDLAGRVVVEEGE